MFLESAYGIYCLRKEDVKEYQSEEKQAFVWERLLVNLVTIRARS